MARMQVACAIELEAALLRIFHERRCGRGWPLGAFGKNVDGEGESNKGGKSSFHGKRFGLGEL